MSTNNPRSGREASDADLARRAFQAARLAARNQPQRTRPKNQPRRGKTRDGREPCDLKTAVRNMIEDRGLDVPMAGGTILDRWPDIAPELAGKVRATKFNPTKGILTLTPSSSTYAAQLRYTKPQLIQRINTFLGQPTVTELHIAPPHGGQPRTTAPEQQPQTAAAAAEPPAWTPDLDVPDDYRTARAAHRNRRTRTQDPERTTTDPGPQLREPEEHFTAALQHRQPPPTADAAVRPPRSSRAAALEKARSDRANRAGNSSTAPQLPHTA